MRQSLAAQCGRSLSMEEEQSSGGAGVYFGCCRGAEFAGEEDERVFVRRGVQRVDLSYDDPVVAGGVLGDDLALEGGEGVRDRCGVGRTLLPSRLGGIGATTRIRVGGVARCGGNPVRRRAPAPAARNCRSSPLRVGRGVPPWRTHPGSREPRSARLDPGETARPRSADRRDRGDPIETCTPDGREDRLRGTLPRGRRDRHPEAASRSGSCRRRADRTQRWEP